MNAHISRVLAKQGIGSAHFSFHGNGESDGGYEDMSFDGLYADAEDIFAWVKKQPYVDTEKMFLSGHSMGGYIAASCAPKIQPHGLILLCPGARLWFSCDQMAKAMKQMGQDLCFKASFNDEMAKHPDPFTEAKGYDGPVMLMRADDDQVDEETCVGYAQLYRNAKFHKVSNGGHDFASIEARDKVEETISSFIKEHI